MGYVKHLIALARDRWAVRAAVHVAVVDALADTQRKLLEERVARNEDIRRLNAEVALQHRRWNTAANQNFDLRQRHHTELVAIRDQVAWGVGAINTVRDEMREMFPAHRRFTEALLSVEKGLRGQLDERVIPHVPLSSLGGGERLVERANTNAGHRPLPLSFGGPLA